MNTLGKDAITRDAFTFGKHTLVDRRFLRFQLKIHVSTQKLHIPLVTHRATYTEWLAK